MHYSSSATHVRSCLNHLLGADVQIRRGQHFLFLGTGADRFHWEGTATQGFQIASLSISHIEYVALV